VDMKSKKDGYNTLFINISLSVEERTDVQIIANSVKSRVVFKVES